MMGRFALLALALAGCDQVFGLSEVTTPPDAAPFNVSGRFHQMYLMNNSSFTPRVVERIYPVGTVAFDAILDDGTRAPVEYRADGSFSFPLAYEGQSYRLVYSVEGTRSEIQHSSLTLRIANLSAGRPDRLPVTSGTIGFTYPLSNGTNHPAHIATTGVYTYSNTGQYGPNVLFNWRLATIAPSGGTGMLDASKYDRAYAVHLVNDTTTIAGVTWTTVSAVSSAAITQSTGLSSTLPAPVAVGRNTCARFQALNVAEHARITAAVPRAYSASYANWLLWMTPAPDITGLAGAHYVGVSSSPTVRDYDIAPRFHDTYAGTTLIVQAFASANFSIALPGAAPVALSNGTARYHKVAPGNPASCTSERAIMDARVGVVGAMTLGGTPLDTDGKQVVLDLTRDVPLTWSLGADGPVDISSVGVYELVVVNGTTTYVVRLALSVVGTSARIDPSYLVSGSKYIIVITSSLGRPYAAQGDVETLSLPWENSVTWSHYFEVKAQ